MSESIRSIKRIIDRMVFSAFRLFFGMRRGNTSKTIVLVRTDGIGDLVFSLPYLQDIRNHFADHRLVLVCRNTAAALAKPNLFDEVIPFRYLQYRWNYFYRLTILSRIRTLLPSYTLYLSYHRQHIGDEMAILSGAERIVAFSGNDEIIHPEMRRTNDRYYSDIVQVEDHSPESDKYLALLKKLNVRTGVGKGGMKEKSESNLRAGFILIAPGGSSALRRWPADRFAELGDRLTETNRLNVVLCGSRDEEVLLEMIAQKMSKPPAVKSGLPLDEVVGLIKRANLVVGNESGLLHMAASLGIPAVVILGGGHFSRYFPYGSARIVSHKLDCYECNWKCHFPEPYCLTKIGVDDVMSAVETMIRTLVKSEA